MQITFVRSSEWRCYSVAERDDGVSLRVPGYGHINPLPHDLTHYMIERELGLRQGFWGSVAAGAIFPGMAVLAGRQPPHAAERGQRIIKENGAEVGRSELLAGAFSEIVAQNLDRHPAVAIARLADAQGVLGRRALPIDAAAVARVCAALREGVARWQQAGVGGSLAVAWSPRADDRRHSRRRSA